jgi:hypothetical protein
MSSQAISASPRHRAGDIEAPPPCQAGTVPASGEKNSASRKNIATNTAVGRCGHRRHARRAFDIAVVVEVPMSDPNMAAKLSAISACRMRGRLPFASRRPAVRDADQRAGVVDVMIRKLKMTIER